MAAWLTAPSVLAGAARHPVGVNSLCAGRRPVTFGRFSRLDHHWTGPAASDRGSERGAATLGRHCPTVAGRPDGHRDSPGNRRVQASFVAVAKHYGVAVDPCPPRRPQRKGVVEKAIHYISQRWWRTATVNSLASAQQSLDEFCVTVGDRRRRADSTVAHLADSEPLLELPAAPYPAEGALERKVASNGLVSVWGNQYSVPPGVIGTDVTVRWRLGDPTIHVFSATGRLVASHQKAHRGQGRTVRLPEHTQALENVVLAEFTTKRPCSPKPNRPPTKAAFAIAAEIRANQPTETVIDLGVYQQHIDRQHQG